jgi:RES domain-containing protein
MNYKYDVALSFAGEQRDFAREVANRIASKGLRVFYDEFFEAELWGKDLGDYLDTVYRKESRYIIIFVSKEYSEKKWTNHERKSALAAAIESDSEKVLPIRCDETELEGLRSSVAYLNASNKTSDQISELVYKKTLSLLNSENANNSTSKMPLSLSTSKMPLSLWRIVTEKFIDDAFSGNAASQAGGRWNSRGTKVVYASSSLSLATIEILINLPNGFIPNRYVAIEAKVPPALSIESVRRSELPSNWMDIIIPEETRKIGDAWIACSEACILSVPSALISQERSYLINPSHRDFSKIAVVSKEYINFDHRLFS